MIGGIVPFAVVGAIGFGVDGLSLMLLMTIGLPPLIARPPAFLIAVTATFLLNRVFTFTERRAASARSEAAGYLAVQVLGALVNYGVFAAVLGMIPTIHPLLALAAGSIVGMVFNFAVLRTLVYRR
ncbi:GtrA family protein [Devosia sp.]|uniref:GtrA family protein n=1 Tax=Devosia sp. TaxID=1871048 RepID=UPI0035AEEEF7